MAFIVDCTFSPETCNKVIETKVQEQNYKNNAFVVSNFVHFLSLFVTKKIWAGENVTLLKRSFCLIFAFQSSLIMKGAQESFDFDRINVNFVLKFSAESIFAKPLSCTSSKMKQRLKTIYKYF